MLPRLFPHVFPLTGLLHLGFPLIIVSVSCDFTSHVVLCTFIKYQICRASRVDFYCFTRKFHPCKKRFYVYL